MTIRRSTSRLSRLHSKSSIGGAQDLRRRNLAWNLPPA
jgi:hypothetical protein